MPLNCPMLPGQRLKQSQGLILMSRLAIKKAPNSQRSPLTGNSQLMKVRFHCYRTNSSVMWTGPFAAVRADQQNLTCN